MPSQSQIFQSASSTAAAIRAKQISSAEALAEYLAQVERVNPALNAIVTLDTERACARAREADSAIARGELWGPLHGVPLTVKDSLETTGLRTTAGAVELASHVPAGDAVAVERLRRAGAVIFGKSNMPRFAVDFQT